MNRNMIDKKLEKKSKENERSNKNNEECDEKIEFDLFDLLDWLNLIERILCIGFVICGLAKMIFEFCFHFLN